MVESRVKQGDKERDANKNATLRAIVDKINKSFRLPGHIWNFIHVLWLPVDAQLRSAASALSFCCLFREILVRFLVIFLLFFFVAPCLLLSEYFSHFYKFSFSAWFSFTLLRLHIYSASSFARISLTSNSGNSLFRHSLHALRESVIERHFEEGRVDEWAFGSEHLLHVTLLLLPACAAVLPAT